MVFLSPECPLSQNYTKTLNELSAKYKGQCQIIGIIPGTAYSSAEIAKFKKDYHIGFELRVDKKFEWTKRLGATTTPEAFLMTRDSVIYAGLIDNWAASLGVQRTVITEHYLADAIDSALHHHSITTSRTLPVGCLINTK